MRPVREMFTQALCALAEALGRKADEGEVFRSLSELDKETIFSAKAAWAGAKALRSQGLLIGAYRLEEPVETVTLRTPFLTGWQGELCLVRRFSQDTVEIQTFEENTTKTSLSKEAWLNRWTHPIFLSPPQPNVLVESLRGEVVPETAPVFCSIYRFCEENERAARHLSELVQKILARAVAEQRVIVYVDELGLIPEETVKTMGFGKSEEEAYKWVRETLDGELRGLERGIASYDKSPLYQELYKVLAFQAKQGVKIRAISEDLTYALWKKIVDCDHETDPKRHELIKLFLGLKLDLLAATSLDIIRRRWMVNDWERDEAFLKQISSIIQENGANTLVLTLRTGAHLGIETRLPLSGTQLFSYALSEVPEPEYLLTENHLGLLWNNGVVLPSSEVALLAARDVLSVPLVTHKVKSGLSPYRAQWETQKALAKIDYQDLLRIAIAVVADFFALQQKREEKTFDLTKTLHEETEKIWTEKDRVSSP